MIEAGPLQSQTAGSLAIGDSTWPPKLSDREQGRGVPIGKLGPNAGPPYY